jgi:archaellum component FlaG (FlaF/FlaG flagellin family)
MSFDDAFLGLMNSTVTVSTRGASNNYGEPSFSTSSVDYRARIVEKPGFIRSAQGEDIGYSHTLWIRSTGSVSITATDRITLPDGSSPPVVAVERYPDETGPNHVKVMMGA